MSPPRRAREETLGTSLLDDLLFGENGLGHLGTDPGDSSSRPDGTCRAQEVAGFVRVVSESTNSSMQSGSSRARWAAAKR